MVRRSTSISMNARSKWCRQPSDASSSFSVGTEMILASVITVTSAISLLVGASLGDIAGGDTTRFSALAAGTALLVALIALIAWLVKAGSILDTVANAHNATPGQIALAWVLKRSPVMLPIPGTSKVTHLEENVAAVNIELSDEEFDSLDREGRTEYRQA